MKPAPRASSPPQSRARGSSASTWRRRAADRVTIIWISVNSGLSPPLNSLHCFAVASGGGDDAGRKIPQWLHDLGRDFRARGGRFALVCRHSKLYLYFNKLNFTACVLLRMVRGLPIAGAPDDPLEYRRADHRSDCRRTRRRLRAARPASEKRLSPASAPADQGTADHDRRMRAADGGRDRIPPPRPRRREGCRDPPDPYRAQYRLKPRNDQQANQPREPAMSTPTTELVARLADAFEFMMDGKAEASPLALLQDATESAQAPSIAECVPLMAIALELINRGPTTISIEGVESFRTKVLHLLSQIRPVIEHEAKVSLADWTDRLAAE